ncbi:vegetative incompatibility protein HET-E-1 [Seiridium cupressi]
MHPQQQRMAGLSTKSIHSRGISRVGFSKRHLSATTRRGIRLINVCTLDLEEFHGHHTQPYATLSHTWGDSEISFQRWQQPDDHTRRSQGYQKILGAYKTAESRGYRYLWCDTNCIDKTSSAELAEAINSMFTWYQCATEAFAYLADVSPLSPGFMAYLNLVAPGRRHEEHQEIKSKLQDAFNLVWPELKFQLKLNKKPKQDTKVNETYKSDIQALANSRWFTRAWTLQGS